MAVYRSRRIIRNAAVALMALTSLAAPLTAVAALTIVKDGVAIATIVIGTAPNTVEQFAAEELVLHVKAISGAVIDIVPDPVPGMTPVYIGRAAAQVGITAADLLPEHYRIKTSEGWLAVAGHDVYAPNGVKNPLDQRNVQPGTLFGIYHVLDHVLGVRWLWPGADGTHTPRNRTITIPDLAEESGPALVQREMRSVRSKRSSDRLFSKTDGLQRTDAAIVKQQYAEEQLWLRRQRMGRRSGFAFGHAFTRWWKQYSETHPEYFAELPGREQPYGPATDVKLCVSNPAVTNQIIADWRKRGAKSHLAACPNDGRLYCTCANCRSWDLPIVTTPKTVDESVLTYRYARFWKVLAEKVLAINPDVYVCGYAYSNYNTGPDTITFPPNVLLGYVGGMGDAAREDWRKWAAAGAKLFFRPNWFHTGSSAFHLPLQKAGDFMKFAGTHNMLGTDFDSLLGHYATQGAFYYLVARLHARPELSVETVIAEYCSAFGAAAPEIRKYLDYWGTVGAHYAQEALARSKEFRSGQRAALRIMPEIFTDDVLAEGETHLAAAAAKLSASEDTAGRRVEFLRLGLEHVRLTRDAVRYGNDIGSVRGIRENALNSVAAAKKLRAFRQRISGTFVAWSEYCSYKEIDLGDYTGLRLAAVLGERDPIAVLPAAWHFRFDPEDAGEREAWFGPNHDPRRETWDRTQVYRWWERNAVGKKWKEEHGEDYNGAAWYRTRFRTPALSDGKRLKLLFGAVDESCKVWLNGVLAGEHPFVEPDDWKTPFEFDITDHLQPDMNELAVRVVDNSGVGGIWKLVWLVR